MPKLAIDHLTVGELLDCLERVPKDDKIEFEFAGLVPLLKFSSYRGFYEDLAIRFGMPETFDEIPTAGQLSFALVQSIGTCMTGYKGGVYRITRDTTIWVAAPGDTSNTVICGITNYEGQYVLNTRYLAH